MSKRYYWLKLKEDFFRDPKIKKLRKVAGGDTAVVIYLKMLILAINNEGVLRYEGLEKTFEEEVALCIDEQPENVTMTISFLLSCGMLEESYPTYLLTQSDELVGSETRNAEAMRKKRERERTALEGKGNDNVTLLSDVTNRYTEIDIEKDTDKD